MSIKYKRVERSRSPTLIVPLFDPDDLKQVKEDLRVERKAYKALINDNSQLYYLIKLGFKVFHNLRQYKNIFEYWQGESGVNQETKQWIYFLQLEH